MNRVPIALYRTENNEFVKYVRYDDYKKIEDILKEVREFVENNINPGDYSIDISRYETEELVKILDKEKK